jgi:hypothetical protein
MDKMALSSSKAWLIEEIFGGKGSLIDSLYDTWIGRMIRFLEPSPS